VQQEWREMAGNLIDVAHHGSVAIVTLRYPPANAMSLELTEEIAAVFERLGQDSSLRSLVLSGQGNYSAPDSI
jgi:enoyl-CoA hydratase/carnithine racemase